MNKIGIVSCYYVKNYGSMLQAYAVQKMLDNMNIENENLVYVKSKNPKQLVSYARRLLFDSNIRKTKLKILKKKIYSEIHKKYKENFKTRDKKFEEFKSKYFKVSKPYLGYENLQKSSEDYDAFVLGSDQLWHPMNLENHYFTMEFIEDNKPKITYATSFGVSEIPKNQIEKTKSYLKRIEYISVREKTGKNIIKQLIGRDVPVVLDPTFMLSLEEWESLQPENNVYTKNKYIFCYFLGDNQEHRDVVNKVKKITGYDIVTLPHIDEIAKSDKNFGDESLYNVGPSEFINLIKNAEIVFTDSFHCTAFSIMYKKNFITFNRFKNDSKISTNSRIASLFGLLKLKDRLYDDKKDINTVIKKEINYLEVERELEKLRANTKEYISNAIRKSLKDIEV